MSAAAWANLKWVVTRLRPYRWRVVAAIVVVAVGTAVAVGGPLLMRYVIDDALPQHNLRLLLWAAALLFSLPLLGAATAMAEAYVLMGVGARLTADLRRELYAHALQLQISVTDAKPVGELAEGVTLESGRIGEVYVNQTLGGVFAGLVNGGAVLIALWSLSGLFVLAALLTWVGDLLLAAALNGRVKRLEAAYLGLLTEGKGTCTNDWAASGSSGSRVLRLKR